MKKSLLRDLKVLYLNKMEESSAKVKSPLIRRTWIEPKGLVKLKRFIRNLPFIGGVLWYFYNLLMAPFRIRNLFADGELLQEHLTSLSEKTLRLEARIDEEIVPKIENLRAELSYKFTEPAEVMILNIAPLMKEEAIKKELNFYTLLEGVFRGADLKKDLAKYLPFIQESLTKLGPGHSFLDFGCGRGEFLELLKESGVSALGVEVNEDYVHLLDEKGFSVHYGDGLEYLRGLPDESLLGVSAIHVIEHLEFEKQKELLELAFRKIRSGGLLIVETPNPKCSIALANFYIDYTHIRPCPHELLSYLFQFFGFKDLKLVMSAPVDRWFRVGNPLADYMDYGLVGYKG